MQRWLATVAILGTLLSAGAARAQSPIVLSNLQVDLWPEYDQPSMLVLYDFMVSDGTQLPASLTMRIPREANLTAVAVHGTGTDLFNSPYSEAEADDAWQYIVVQVTNPDTYRIEYVQPLARAGITRHFAFTLPGDFEIQHLRLSVRMPGDATSVDEQPPLQAGQNAGATYYLVGDFGEVKNGEEFSFSLTYDRAAESPVEPDQGLAPSKPLDANTAGRVMIGNYLPYIVAILGVLLIAGGSFYFWQSSRSRPAGTARRHRAARGQDARSDETYCPQCGTRARPGDKFCRVCGTKLGTFA